MIDINHCISSIKKWVPYSRDLEQPDMLLNPVTQSLFEGTLLIDTCDLDDLAPYSIGTKEWTGVIKSGVPKNQQPDRIFKYMAEKSYISPLHKEFALNLVKKDNLYYKLDADAPYTGPIYYVYWDDNFQIYDFLHEDGDGGLKKAQEQINAELGERIELFKHEYAHVDGVGGDFFRLTVKKAGQFKNGKLEGTFKEYERDCYNPDIEYVSANYSYHQGLLDGITSLSWLGDRGCDYHTYETIEYTNGFKNGFQKHYQRDIDLYRTYSYIHACTKFKKGKLIEEIHDEETLRKLFPDEFCMEPRRL